MNIPVIPSVCYRRFLRGADNFIIFPAPQELEEGRDYPKMEE
jgi:hypothetical protein